MPKSWAIFKLVSTATFFNCSSVSNKPTSLGENFGGLDIKWTIPEGGCYLWITFPENVDMDSLQQHCFDNGVGYLSGIKFSPKGDSGHNSARLCFAYESPEKNRAGINKFAEILRQKKVI